MKAFLLDFGEMQKCDEPEIKNLFGRKKKEVWAEACVCVCVCRGGG